MADGEAGGDGAHAAGHGSDGLDNGLHLVKGRVARDAALGLVPVDGDVHHLNVALVGFVCAAMTCLPGAVVNGATIAAYFLTTGFSF